MPQMTLTDNLTAILELARWAPSVHNSQPWKVRLSGPDRLTITIDERHRLRDGDPTGRETYISLGIFVEATNLAASTVGLQVTAVDLKDSAVELSFSPFAGGAQPLVPFLKQRCSDRSVFKPVTITPKMVQSLEASRASAGVTTRVITDALVIDTVADLTSKGIGVALSSPGFRQELSGLLTLPGSSRHRGIAVRSLYISPLLELFEPLLMRLGVGVKAEVDLEKRRWQSASAIIAILADGDMPKYWLEVGRSYLGASLQAEALGLSQATSAAIVEASNYHEDVEALLGTNQRVLSLIRLGKGSPKKHFSPRLSAEELLT